MRALAILVLAALAATGAHAADCLAPLSANEGWSCRGQLSNGASVDFCAELTNGFGGDRASRYFKMTSTGPYLTTCTCQTRGKTGFGEDSAYLCVDRDTLTVVEARVSRRRIVGQTFNASVDVRGTFTCEPDPACDVQPVIDADLPPLHAAGTVTSQEVVQRVGAGGNLGLGYLGCAGFTTEAPTWIVDFQGPPAPYLDFYFRPDGPANAAASVVVVSPSGVTRCESHYELIWVQPEPGPYRIWVGVEPEGALHTGELLIAPLD